MFQVTKAGEYTTKNGRKARIMSTNPIIGFVETVGGRQVPLIWQTDGKALSSGNDLVGPWQDRRATTVDIYVFLDKRGNLLLSYTKPQDTDFIGLKKVSVTVTEGEGVQSTETKEETTAKK